MDVSTGLNRSLTVESGEVYYVAANFGRRSTSGGNEGGTGGSSGGGNSGGSNGGTTVIPDTQTPLDPGITIDDQEVPLAGAVGLNDADHFAYVIGYEEDGTTAIQSGIDIQTASIQRPVDEVYTAECVIGYEEDGTVRPLNNISRAEVATIFFRLMTEEFRQSMVRRVGKITLAVIHIAVIQEPGRDSRKLRAGNAGVGLEAAILIACQNPSLGAGSRSACQNKRSRLFCFLSFAVTRNCAVLAVCRWLPAHASLPHMSIILRPGPDTPPGRRPAGRFPPPLPSLRSGNAKAHR